MTNENKNNEFKLIDYIDPVAIIGFLKSSRKVILISTVILFAIGLLIAFTSPKEYSANCTIIAESSEGSGGSISQLSSLAGLAGIDLNLGSSKSLSPEVYPQVVASIPFQLKMLNQPLEFSTQDSLLSSYDYFKNVHKPALTSYIAKYTIGLPGLIIGLFSSTPDEIGGLPPAETNDIINISLKDHKLIESFKQRIVIETDYQTGLIIITTTMPDPLASANLTELTVDLLQNYITDYKISKATTSLKFIEERHEEARTAYYNAQQELAIFDDRNKNVRLETVRLERQILENKNEIAFTVYKGLAQQLEQAKIRVKEDTPIFTIVEPIQVPLYKSKPNQLLIVLMFGVLGVITGIVIALIKLFASKLLLNKMK